MLEGLAIQSTFGRLTSSFCGFRLLPKDLASPKQICAGVVNYINYDRGVFMDKHFALNGFQLVTHKRRSFAQEHEVRAVCWISGNCGPAHSDTTPKHNGIYVDCDVARLVERVYVSPLAGKYVYDGVAAVCKAFELQVPVIQSNLMQKPLY
jgi:hypothetical protein